MFLWLCLSRSRFGQSEVEKKEWTVSVEAENFSSFSHVHLTRLRRIHCCRWKLRKRLQCSVKTLLCCLSFGMLRLIFSDHTNNCTVSSSRRIPHTCWAQTAGPRSVPLLFVKTTPVSLILLRSCQKWDGFFTLLVQTRRTSEGIIWPGWTCMMKTAICCFASRKDVPTLLQSFCVFLT